MNGELRRNLRPARQGDPLPRSAAAICAAVFLAAAAGLTPRLFAGPLEFPILFTQIPPGTAAEGEPPSTGGMLRARYGERGRIVRLDPDGAFRVLTPGFHSACGADVSFDGRRFLFAAKRAASDSWGIFECSVDGGEARQVVGSFGNCYDPVYQSTLYTLQSKEPWYQLMFVSDASGCLNEYGSGLALNLYSAKLDGTGLRRLTFNLSDDMDPAMLVDGRIVFASWWRFSRSRSMARTSCSTPKAAAAACSTCRA